MSEGQKYTPKVFSALKSKVSQQSTKEVWSMRHSKPVSLFSSKGRERKENTHIYIYTHTKEPPRCLQRIQASYRFPARLPHCLFWRGPRSCCLRCGSVVLSLPQLESSNEAVAAAAAADIVCRLSFRIPCRPPSRMSDDFSPFARWEKISLSKEAY